MDHALAPSDLAPGLLLGPDVRIAAGVEIGGHVVIHAGTNVAAGVTIADHAVVGKQPRLGPRSSASRAPLPPAVLGEGSAVLTGAVVFAGAELRAAAIAGDQSHVRERAVIGAGSVVGRGSSVDNDVTIGARVQVQSNCYLTGYSLLEDDVFVGPGVTTTNDHTMARLDPDSELKGVTLRRACRIGGGAVIVPGVEVGEEAFVAAGAVVAADVPPRTVAMGVPARPVREVPAEDLLENRR